MKVVHLEAAADHVERLARENEPTRALIEIIWNIRVADDGHHQNRWLSTEA